MKINIQLTEEDYIQATYLHIRPRPLFKWASYILVAFLLFTLVASIFVAVAHPEQIYPPILMGGLFVYFWFIFGVWTPRRCRKTFRQQKALQLPYSFEFNDENFIARAEYGETKLTWDYLRKWKEGKTIFTVYQSDRIMQMIPKRCFTSPEEMTQLRELLTRKIGPTCP